MTCGRVHGTDDSPTAIELNFCRSLVRRANIEETAFLAQTSGEIAEVEHALP